jgi:hypothetical protein
MVMEKGYMVGPWVGTGKIAPCDYLDLTRE